MKEGTIRWFVLGITILAGVIVTAAIDHATGFETTTKISALAFIAHNVAYMIFGAVLSRIYFS